MAMRPLVLLIFLLFLLQDSALALQKSYVVYLGSHSHGLDPTAADTESVRNSHYELLSSVSKSGENVQDKIFYSYTNSINGFAAVLDEEEAAELAKHPDVVSVFPNMPKKLHTTRSWHFLGLEGQKGIPGSSLWNQARFGEGVIIGNLDTGVWPESASFNDEGVGAVPSKWKGACQNDDPKDNFRCNRKLIGARYFSKGYAAGSTKFNFSITSPRDIDGHGTHTLSTAGGNFAPGATVFGNGNGTAKGGSPHAHVAAYKVCWPPKQQEDGGCYDADILAGFDAAIRDGVDVLSVSLGGGAQEFANDGIAIGSFHAVSAGIVVVASAGNDGPAEGSIGNGAPWILTVAASTIDRQFTNYVSLGNKKHLKGTSLSEKGLPGDQFYPLISGADANAANKTSDDSSLCLAGSLDPKKVKGKIVVCLRGQNGRVEKGANALLAGAVGMVLANAELNGNELLSDAHLLPASHVNYTDGQAILNYIKSTKNPYAHITRPTTDLGVKPAPVTASFSSRGPNSIEPSILKPDITAPGVNVIAAFSLATAPSDLTIDKRRISYNTESGTSMSCPHISGVVGLLKALHPDWSHAAIRSAIMTTARTRDNTAEPILDSSYKKGSPFEYGAGHVRPNRAADPGLVYDLATDDYLNFLCARGYSASDIKVFTDKPYACPRSYSLLDFNYPSISVPNLNSSITITRRVKNVGSPGTYYAKIRAPAGVSVSVNPTTLKFEKTGEEKTFKVTLNGLREKKPIVYAFGGLTWTDGKHFVRSPLAVKHL